jgi:anti-anti-sigma factor
MTPNELAVVRISSRDGTVIAEIDGEIDPTNARDVGQRLTEAVPNDALAVVVDLSGIEFIDSSGVQMLFELAERLTGRQQALSVVVPPECPARRVLEIVAFAATAPLLDSRDELDRNGCGQTPH